VRVNPDFNTGMSMQLVSAPLSDGFTVQGLTGVSVFEVQNEGERLVALSIIKPCGTVLGVLLDAVGFDLFCGQVAPIVARRAHPESVSESAEALPSLSLPRVLQ
jgi:hypothetical protein